MIIRYLAVCAALATSAVSYVAGAEQPLPSPSQYATPNYTIAFNAPRHTTYCPLPASWTGSDHGTTIFLTPPRICGGAGYPSSARGFEPATTPRIEVYYGYYDGEDQQDSSACRVAGHARLFGRLEPLCLSERGGLEVVTVHGLYQADSTAEISLSLVAAAKDQPKYLGGFLVLAASVHTCTTTWRDEKNPKKISHTGHGPPCGEANWF